MRIDLYAQNKNSLVVNGVPLSGFAEGDWMEIKLDGNAAERTKGGDGPGISISTAQGGQVTFSLMPTSPALGVMYGLRNTQQVNPSLFSVAIFTGVEELISCLGCAFGDLPAFATGGEKMSPRKFVLEFQKIVPDLSDVESLVGTVIGEMVGSAIGSLI